MVVISPVTSFCPKLPYEKLKIIKKNIRLKLNMAISGLHPGPRLWCLRGERKHPRTSEPLQLVLCQSASHFTAFFLPFLRRWWWEGLRRKREGQRV